MVQEIFCNSGIPFQNLSVIYCNYQYYSFIYLVVFILVTYFWVSMMESIPGTTTKIIEEAPFGIPKARTEHEKDLRGKPIVDIKIFFLLEVDQSSCD